VTLLASPDRDGADACTGLVVLLALSERPGAPTGTVTLVTDPADPAWTAITDRRLWIGPVGHRATHGGSQGWPGAWSWILPNRGDFLGFAGAGARDAARAWAAVSPVDIMALPGRWGPRDLPPDTLVLTDTGAFRAPTGHRDTVDALDLDQVSRVVDGVAAWVAWE
jgi:hypothetical protein